MSENLNDSDHEDFTSACSQNFTSIDRKVTLSKVSKRKYQDEDRNSTISRIPSCYNEAGYLTQIWEHQKRIQMLSREFELLRTQFFHAVSGASRQFSLISDAIKMICEEELCLI
jgi:hypothetical protein